ncbi:hypothetical protein [Paraglaciecola aestuariivivens]
MANFAQNIQTIPICISLLIEDEKMFSPAVLDNIKEKLATLSNTYSNTRLNVTICTKSAAILDSLRLLSGENLSRVRVFSELQNSGAFTDEQESQDSEPDASTTKAHPDIILSVAGIEKTSLTEEELNFLLPKHSRIQILSTKLHGNATVEMLRLMTNQDQVEWQYWRCNEPITQKVQLCDAFTEEKLHDLQQLDEYNKSLSMISEKQIASSYPLLNAQQIEALKLVEDGPLSECHQHYLQADVLAMQQQQKSTLALRLMAVVSLLSATIFLINANLFKHVSLMACYLSLLFIGFMLTMYASRKKYYEKHLQFRCLSEFFRIKFFWLLNESSQEEPAYYHDHVTLRTVSNLGWIMASLKNCPQRGLFSQNEQRCQDILASSWIADQKGYFNKTLVRFSKLKQRLSALSIVTMCTAIMSGTMSISTMLFSHWFPEHWELNLLRNIFIFMAGWFALAVAVLEVYKMKMANEDVKQLNQRMFNVLKNGERMLKQSDELVSRHIIMRTLLVEATTEILEWFNTKSVHSVKAAQDGLMRLVNS